MSSVTADHAPGVAPGLKGGCPVTSGLRKRARSYLNVPSATVTDAALSFKARGILVYLLDKPAGWDVRSASIAADSPDGKAAVQAGLRELARAGYYRIERRRLLDGRLVTGTAVSEEPVASWAEEYAEYQGPVPVVQQPGGGFKVKHKDGSLTGDGFRAGPEPEPPAATAHNDDHTEGRVSAGRTGTQFSGAGSAGSGQTGAGSAGSGKLGAFTNTEEPLQRHIPRTDVDARGPATAADAGPGQPVPGCDDLADGPLRPDPKPTGQSPDRKNPEDHASGSGSARQAPGPVPPPAETGPLPITGHSGGRPPVPAAAAAGGTGVTTAQSILRDFIDWDRAAGGCLTRRTIGQLARQIGDLLDQGIGDRPIRRGLADWRAAGQHPATLDSFVNAAMKGAAPAANGRASPNGQVSVGDSRIAEGHALKARLAARQIEMT